MPSNLLLAHKLIKRGHVLLFFLIEESWVQSFDLENETTSMLLNVTVVSLSGFTP